MIYLDFFEGFEGLAAVPTAAARSLHEIEKSTDAIHSKIFTKFSRIPRVCHVLLRLWLIIGGWRRRLAYLRADCQVENEALDIQENPC